MCGGGILFCKMSYRTNSNLGMRNGDSSRRCFLDYRELVIQNHVNLGLKGTPAAHGFDLPWKAGC